MTTIFCSHATDCLLGTHRKPCVRPTSSRSYPITRLHMIDPSSLHNRRVINFTLEYCLSLNVALFANIFCRSISSEICKFFPPFVPSKAVVLHATVRAIKGRSPSCHRSCHQRPSTIMPLFVPSNAVQLTSSVPILFFCIMQNTYIINISISVITNPENKVITFNSLSIKVSYGAIDHLKMRCRNSFCYLIRTFFVMFSVKTTRK